MYYSTLHHISEYSCLQVLFCIEPHLRRQLSSGIILHCTTSQNIVVFSYYFELHHIWEHSCLQVLFCIEPHLRIQLSSGIILHCTTSDNTVVFRYYFALHHISENSCLQVSFYKAQLLRRQLSSGLFCTAPHLRRKYSSGIIMHGTISQKRVVFRFYSARHHISEESTLQLLSCMAPYLRRE